MQSVHMTEEIVWFETLGKNDTARAGGKGANLGELTVGGLPVPRGFVITATAYLEAMEQAGIRGQLRDDSLAAATGEPAALQAKAEALAKQVRAAGVPRPLAELIGEAYRALSDGENASARVAVRSSATAEDTAGTSFAGMHKTFTNVQAWRLSWMQSSTAGLRCSAPGCFRTAPVN